jgi:asparagine synthase (glutamine-hydrolysing)
MCGIAGRVNVGAPVDGAQLRAMAEVMAPRGPDGEGFFREGTVGLAHRRLAIVDLAGGAQPLVTGRAALVGNNEIYDHLELRAELEGRGHTFRTRCDTEAMLHAHEEWGADAPRRLRGMFAYAAWDRRARRLTLARDRLGIKPLYYAHLPGGDLLFASDLRALLCEAEVDRRLDEDALAAFLALRYVPGPATLLAGVRKLLPGHTLVWQDGRASVRPYWRVPVGEPAVAPPPTEAEAGGRLCALLDECVSLWRMSDVPLGAFLSGGLDSTLVTAILCRLAREGGEAPPRTFSVGWSGEHVAAHDELAWARRAAKALGTTHREVVVSGADVAAALPRIAAQLDEPLGDPAAISLWFLARRARREVTVVLSGEGADEVFAGYAAYGRRLAAERLARLPGATAAARLFGRVAGGRAGRAANLLVEPYRGVPRAVDRATRAAFGAGDDAVEWLLMPARRHAALARTPLGRLLAFDQQVWLPDDLLVKADKMTMAHALELRVPLLDHVLVDEVAAWPDAWKLRGGTGKWLLRRAARGLVPDEILDRPKMGFATPVGAWLRGPLRPLVEELLPRGLAAERGAVPAVRRLIDEHRRGADRADALFTLLALELFRGGLTWTSSASPTIGTEILSARSTSCAASPHAGHGSSG